MRFCILPVNDMENMRADLEKSLRIHDVHKTQCLKGVLIDKGGSEVNRHALWTYVKPSKLHVGEPFKGLCANEYSIGCETIQQQWEHWLCRLLSGYIHVFFFEISTNNDQGVSARKD